MMQLLTKKEIKILKHYVDEDILYHENSLSTIESKKNFSDNQKEILEKVIGKNYFKDKTRVKTLEANIRFLKKLRKKLDDSIK